MTDGPCHIEMDHIPHLNMLRKNYRDDRIHAESRCEPFGVLRFLKKRELECKASIMMILQDVRFFQNPDTSSPIEAKEAWVKKNLESFERLKERRG